MIRRGLRMSSIRSRSAWLIVAAGLALSMALVLALAAAQLSVTLPWWLTLAAPPILYGFLVRLSVRRVSPSRWIGATAFLWVVHALAGVLTAAAAGFVPSAVGQIFIITFPPALLPHLLWVPLLLVPLRDVLARGPRRSRGRRVSTHERGVVLGGRAPTGAAAPSTQPDAASAEPIAGDGRERPGEAGARHPSVRHAESPASHVAPPPAGAVGAVAVAEPARTQPLFEKMLARETSADVLRVTFDRIVEQLPAAAFKLPLEQMAATLLEPGYLLVPQRLVLVQLTEGQVRVGWEVVGGQFPQHLLAMTEAEIAGAIPGGQLVLPLDELVPQLPRELFLPAGPAVDLDGIERFPAPFQPSLQEKRGSAAPKVASPVVEVQTVTEAPPAAASTEWVLEDEAEPPVELSAIPELKDVELDLASIVTTIESAPAPVDLGAAETDVLAAALATERYAVDDEPEAAAEPDGRGRPPSDRRADEVGVGLVAGPEDTTGHEETAAALEVTASLAALGPLNVGADSVDGVTLFSACAPGIPREMAVTAARLMLPLLDDGRALWAVEQLTLRSADVALVLTPLRPMRHGGPVLVAALPPRGSLALLEMLCRRAAARYGGHAELRRERAGDLDEPDLLDMEPATRVCQITASLDAVGPVIASVLRDAEAEYVLYLFLPPGSDVRGAAGFAYDLARTMRSARGAGMAFHSAALACGKRRMVIQLENHMASRTTIVVAAGETDRPGLAYRQVESAAVTLGAA